MCDFYVVRGYLPFFCKPVNQPLGRENLTKPQPEMRTDAHVSMDTVLEEFLKGGGLFPIVPKSYLQKKADAKKMDEDADANVLDVSDVNVLEVTDADVLEVSNADLFEVSDYVTEVPDANVLNNDEVITLEAVEPSPDEGVDEVTVITADDHPEVAVEVEDDIIAIYAVDPQHHDEEHDEVHGAAANVALYDYHYQPLSEAPEQQFLYDPATGQVFLF